MQKMLATSAETYFPCNTLPLFLKALVASNLQPILQANKENKPQVARAEQPETVLPDWLRDGQTEHFIETFRPTVLMLARELHTRVSRVLSVSLDDLVQEGLIAVWQCIARYDATKTEHEHSFRAYCKIRARGAMIDAVRRLGREHAISLDAYLSCDSEKGEYQRDIADPSTLSMPISSVPDPQVLALRQRVRASLALLTLKEQQAIKGAFCLEDENGVSKTFDEMVVCLQVKRKSLQEYKRRALRKLATLLADQGVLQ